MRKYIWLIFRIVATIFLLYKAFSEVDFGKVFLTQQSFSFLWFTVAVLSLFSAYLLGGLRWTMLMKKTGFKGRVIDFVLLYFSGCFINQGIPSTIGGDSYRAIKASQLNSKNTKTPQKDNELSNSDLKLSFSVMILDRLMGLAGNNILGGIGLVIAGYKIIEWGSELGITILGITILVGVVGSLLMNIKFCLFQLEKILNRFNLSKLIASLKLTFQIPNNSLQLFLSLLMNFLTIIALGFCFKTFGVNVPFEALMIGVPALTIILILPVSISGWGLRETTLSSVLMLWNIDPTLTVISSVTFGLINVLVLLPGIYRLIKN